MGTVDDRDLPVDLRIQGFSDVVDIFKGVIHRRLSALYDSARELLFDDTSRMVFFSDCHRGDRGRNDAFAVNEPLFIQALTHYFNLGFTYFEVGDGDELWQNRKLSKVVRSHRPIFDLLHRFEAQNRLHLILGNHDVAENPCRAIDKDGMALEHGLILRHRRTHQKLFVLHGHQADFKSDILSPVSRAFVRHVWRYVQQWPVTEWFKDVIPGADYGGIERRLMAWMRPRDSALICGHTHRSVMAKPGELPYFNTGSWLEPGVATGLEIQDGMIQLVRWVANPITHDIRRELVTTPRRLRLFA
jgi:UDP-2,3-diacylglucosamine pyrophosphatase LpxH